jgi:hypothetical protein
MRNKTALRGTKVLALLSSVLLLMPTITVAQSSSPNYRVEESYFGTGGQVDATSTDYRARESTGSLGVGDASSPDYRLLSGFNTPSEPFLQVVVTGATVDFGTLDDSTPKYGAAQADACNCSFVVRTYLSSEYNVITASDPPTSENNESLAAKAIQGVPSLSQSIEEFGMNLVDNSTPDTGANPVNQPDNSFADGVVTAGYEIPNQYKYGKGDTIAHAPGTVGKQGIGQTDYTISYMAKVSSITAAGVYTMNHEIIVVASY